MSKPEIYISYAWREREEDPSPDDRESIVDEFCKACKSHGYTVKRDKSHLSYRKSIQNFMNEIGAGKYVLVVVSDKYLRSTFCMYEAVRILDHERFEERVFPIVLPDAEVFNEEKALDYKVFWKKQLEAFSKKLDDAGRDSVTDKQEQSFRSFYGRVSEFIYQVARLNVGTPESHLENGFAEIFKAIERQVAIDENLLVQIPPSYPVSASNLFVERAPEDLLEDTISIFDGHKRQIDLFFENPHKRVLLITGPNESGKTHLLRDVVRDAGKALKWVCIRVEPHAFEICPTTPINTDHTLLYYLDDAEYEDETVLKNVFQLIQSHPNTRLVLTTHLLWQEQIKRWTSRFKDFSGLISDIKLSQWNREHLLQLFRLASGGKHLENEEDIVRQFPNPYLLKYFGEASTGKAQLDVVGVGQNFSKKLHRVSEQALQPLLSPELTHLLLLSLVFHQPQNYQLAEMAPQFGLDEQGIQSVFEQLEDAGVVRLRRGIWYLFPDVKADFYLASRLEGIKPKTIEALIGPYLSRYEKTIFTRVVAASRYLSDSAHNAVAEALANTLNLWREEIRQKSPHLSFRWIEAATVALELEQEYGVKNATDAACALVLDVLVKQTSTVQHSESQEESLVNSVIFSSQPDADTYGRFLEKLAHIHRKRKDYLKLVQALWQTGWKSWASNYQPQSLLVCAFKPAYNTVATYNEGLKHARFWLLESNDLQLQELGVAALKTTLGGFFEQTSHEYMKFVISTVGLPANAELYTIRQQALQIVREGIDRVPLQLNCLHIIREIGFGDRLGDHRNIFKLPSYHHIQAEIESLLPLVGKIFLTSQDFLVQKTAEDILLHWWLLDISDNPEIYLLRFERTTEYLLYCYVMNQMYIIEDFKVWKKKAPRGNRWEWYVKSDDLHASKRRKSESEYFKPLVARLSKRYSSEEGIARFIDETVSHLEAWHHKQGSAISHSYYLLGSIVATWAGEQPEIFKKILASDVFHSFLPEHIRAVIGNYLTANQHYTVDDLVEPLLSKIPNLTAIEMRQLVFLIQQHQPQEKEIWLQKIIGEGPEPMLHDIASRLDLLFKSDDETDKIAKYLLLILESGKITREDFFGGMGSNGAASVYGRLYYEHRANLSADVDEKLRVTTFDWVKRISTLKEGESQALHFCIRTSEHLMELIDYRASNWDITLPETDFRVDNVLPKNCFTREELFALFQNADNHRHFIDEILTLEKIPSDWENDYLSLQEPGTNVLWIEKHLRAALAEQNFEKAIEYSEYLPSQEDYIPLMLDTWQKNLSFQSDEEMERLIYNWVTKRDNGFFLMPAGYDFEHSAKKILSTLTDKPLGNSRLTAIISRLSDELKERWKKAEQEDW